MILFLMIMQIHKFAVLRKTNGSVGRFPPPSDITNEKPFED